LKGTSQGEPGVAYKVQYMLLADNVQAIDQGKVNILGTFDNVSPPRLPIRLPRVVLVALLVAETEDELGEHQFSVRIIRPNGQQIGETGTTMRIVPDAGTWPLATVRIILGIGGLPLREAGRHEVQLLVDGNLVGRHPLNVSPPPQQA
jgi:hypothetical protein